MEYSMSYFGNNNRESTLNSTSAILTNGSTWTGTSEDVSNYSSVLVAAKSDVAGMLYMQFSPDNVNWDSSLSFAVDANVNEVHRLTITRKYYRVSYTNNSGANQTYFRLQTLLGSQQALTSALNSSVSSDADSLVTRSVLMGQQGNGNYAFVPVDEHGHIEVSIHGPLLPFGSIHTEKLNPVFQTDAVYGINSLQTKTTTTGSGAVTGSDNLFTCSTGTTIYSSGTLQSRRRLRYRPGQGIVGRYTLKFGTPTANSLLGGGLGSSESGYYFGYNGTVFGILHVTGGKREIQTLTITTASTSTADVQVTLNGVSYTVTGITNSGSTLRTAYEISLGVFAGWDAEVIGSTVVFVSGSTGDKVGAFSVAQSGAGTPVAGSFVETLAGVASTDTWYPQTTWDDPCDGTGASGFILDHSKGNVYQIGIQYLGFGAVTFGIETNNASSNNPSITNVHTLKFANTRTTTHISQPSLPFTMFAYSAGSTTDVSVSCASYSGFVEGEIKPIGGRFTYEDSSVAVSTGAYYALMTIRNDRVYKNRANQSVVNLISFGGAHDDATPVIMYLLKNATLLGTPNFQQWSDSSCTYVDTAATTVTITDNKQLITSIPVGQAGSIIVDFSDAITLQPGETVTLAAKAVTGTSTFTIMTLNTREDQ